MCNAKRLETCKNSEVIDEFTRFVTNLKTTAIMLDAINSMHAERDIDSEIFYNAIDRLAGDLDVYSRDIKIICSQVIKRLAS